MRFATFAQTVLAVSSLVSATPIEKRAFVTDVDYVTDLSIVTTTVGGNTVNQTPASQQHHHSLPEKFRHKAVQHNHHAAKPNFQQAQSQVWTSIVTDQPSQTQTQAQQQQLSTATATQAGPQKQNLVHSHDGEKVWAWTRVFPEHPVTKSAQQAKTTPTPSTASSASPSPSSSSSATSASSSASPSSSSSSSSATNTYQKNVLDSHNIHRSNHSVSALTWSDDLESSALVLAQSCVYGHNVQINGGGYGQNIGYGVSKDNIAKMITNMMYNDEMGFFTPYYGEANPGGNFEDYGHFTQIVWKGTTQVGCATVMCDNLENSGSSQKLPYSVCNYSPAGNVEGEYDTNVLKPLGHPYQSA